MLFIKYLLTSQILRAILHLTANVNNLSLQGANVMNTKLSKTAHTIDRIVKICDGIFKAFIIVLLVFSILVLLLGDKMIATGSLTAELGFVKLHLAPEYQSITAMVKVYTVVSLLCGCVGCAMLAYICSLLRQILVPMKEGRPFEKRVSHDMRKIAWAVLIGGGINEILKLIEQIFVIRALPMDKMFSGDVVAYKEYMFMIDSGFVLLFFVIIFLSYIFSYGQALQQEADETI